jgi:hypothetical protein
MNPARQRREIDIEGAHDNAGVSGLIVMQPDEVAQVQRDDRPALCDRKLQDVGIRNGPAGVAALAHGQGIVPQTPELDYHRLGQFSFAKNRATITPLRARRSAR